MKKIWFVMILSLLCISEYAGQVDSDTTDYVAEKLFVITKNDGTEYFGKIIKQDDREVLIETENLGRLYIPKHEIRSIKEVEKEQMNTKGEMIYEEIFATRYFFSTNGFSLAKGESYIQWNLYGPDLQFGVGEHFSLGFMTTWIGTPMALSAKYTVKLNESVNIGVGTILGTLSWALPDYGLALPFAAVTLGDRTTNLNLCAGYGAFFSEGDSDGRLILSVGGMAKAGKKFTLIFDSFILPPSSNYDEGVAILVPGLRWNTSENKAFQFGFAALRASGELTPIPIPMVQWYNRF